MDIDLYLHVREKEGRLYSDEAVARLPFIAAGRPLAGEWRVRARSAARLEKYLSGRFASLQILDLGCGNGWLSNRLANLGHRVTGLDRNWIELRQAARVFGRNRRLAFIESDIFSAPFPIQTFDVVVLASVIQYFPQLGGLVDALQPLLKPGGEIHIIDSPLYRDEEMEDAQRRSEQYYSALGFPEMARHYAHHRLSVLRGFAARWLYRPAARRLSLKSLFGKADSPFPWIVIRKEDDATIAEAFSLTSEKYDAFAEDHPHLTRMRRKVYAHVERIVPPGARILELNAGAGTDAVELARRGYRVHATDIAPGMLGRLEDKIKKFDLGDRLTAQHCSFTNLDQIQGAPFDAVFSDLGGLNCIPSLAPVIQQLPLVLRPNGIVTWVLMPPLCLWEMAEAFRGQFRLAFRRLKRRGTRAHLEGLHFDVYYFTPKEVLRDFGNDFECLAIEGLSVITPTAESKGLAKKYPRLYRTLAWLDDHLSPRWPWRGWGDFFIVSFRYRPKDA